ncbi:MAG: winged helix-turn-helix domain-containing protein [Pseudomonadota bacterium]
MPNIVPDDRNADENARTIPDQYAFLEFTVSASIRELHERGAPVAIEPKVFDLLLFLIENRERVVTRDEIIDAVWDGRFISDGALSTAISALRRVLGDDGQRQRLVKTVHGRGFRFVGDIEGASTAATSAQLDEIGAPNPSNLNRRRRTLIGRESERAALADLVQPGTLVSIVGPGGAGKTALAIEVALTCGDNFRGGTWFCDFAPIQTGQVESAVMGAMDSSAGAGRVDAATIAERIGSSPTLLIFDNCEHVIDDAAQLADELSQQAPNIALLTTTREALELRDEQLFRLAGLEVDQGDSVAVDLFHHCAKRIVDLPRTGRTDEVISDIVKRLEGLPLAIELAVPRLASNTPAELLRALDDQLSVLATRRPQGEARHRTMDDTIAWSFELLSDIEQKTLVDLSIFSGAFTVQAAEAVCESANTRGVLHDLIGQSMVAFIPGSPASRFRLLEPIRQFAERQLDDAGKAALRERHATWFAARVKDLSQQMRGSNEIEACEALTAEWSDFGRSLEWGREHSRSDVAVAPLAALGIHLLWQLRIEGFNWLEAGVEACDIPKEDQQKTDLVRSMGAWSAGDLDRSEALMKHCIAAGGDTFETAYFEFYQGFAREDFEKVLRCGLAAWKQAEKTDDISWRIATSAFLVCGYAMRKGDAPEISDLLDDIEAMLARHPWPSGQCCALIARVVAAFGRGDPIRFEGHRKDLAKAADRCHAPWFKVTAAGMQSSHVADGGDTLARLAMYTDNLRAAVTSGDVIQLPTILRSAMMCLTDVEQFEAAAQLSGLIPSIRGLGEKGSLAPDYEQVVQTVKSHLGETEFHRLASDGKIWALSDVITHLEAALSDAPSS